MKESKSPDKYLVICMYGIAVFLLLLGGLFLIYGAHYSSLVGLIGAFSCWITSIIIMLIFYKDSVLYEAAYKNKKYSQKDLHVINNFNIKMLKVYLLENCKNCSGLYRKKEFSFTKDAICYYFCISNCSTLEEALQKECERLNTLHEKSKNIAFIIILIKDIVEDSDTENLKRIGKNLYINETLIPQQSYSSIIPAIYEESTMKLRFFTLNKKIDISVYNHACRKLIHITRKFKASI